MHSRRVMVLLHLPTADRKISGSGSLSAAPMPRRRDTGRSARWRSGPCTCSAGALIARGAVRYPSATCWRCKQTEAPTRAESATTRCGWRLHGRARRRAFESSTHDLDYVKARNNAAGLPVASRWLGPQSFRGLLSEVGRGPVVYVPRIPYTTSTSSVLCTATRAGRCSAASSRKVTALSRSVRNSPRRAASDTVLRDHA